LPLDRVARLLGKRLQFFDPGGHDHRRDGGVKGPLAAGSQPAKLARHGYCLQVPLSFALAALAHRAGADAGKDLNDKRQRWPIERPDLKAGAGQPVQRLHAIQRPSAYLVGSTKLEHRLWLDAGEPHGGV
jgi:hypothetical protein